MTTPVTCGSDKGTSCRCYGRSGSRAVSLLRHPTEITAEQQQQNASKIQKGNTKATKAFQSIIPIGRGVKGGVACTWYHWEPESLLIPKLVNCIYSAYTREEYCRRLGTFHPPFHRPQQSKCLGAFIEEHKKTPQPSFEPTQCTALNCCLVFTTG